MPHPKRLGIVLSHPTQYYSPWFRWMAALGWNLRVFYLSNFGVTAQRDPGFGATFVWDVNLLDGYEHEFVPNLATTPSTDTFWGLHNPDLPARLTAWAPEAILLFGYRFRTHLNLIRWARCQRVPLIFRGDSHLLGQPHPPFTKRFALTWLYRQFTAITYVGDANRDYFRTFGVPETRLHFVPHVVDASRFSSEQLESPTAAAALRKQLGLSASTRVVLFAGKFSARKQPRMLLSAFLALAPTNTALVFVGDGEEKAALQDDARRAPPGMVHFLPFANQSEMPARYALADLFVLPSRGLSETWGLAVNEAMHMGVPCLVSDRVGCQQNLVTDGETGWVFCADDEANLREKLNIALRELALDPAPWRARVLARISSYNYDAASLRLADVMAKIGDRSGR